MSSSPPPPRPPGYSPSSRPDEAPHKAGGPQANDRWTRAAVHQQRRAAAQAARQQRAMDRAQLRAARRTSVVGPVLLIVLGGVFLVAEMGAVPWATILRLTGKLWPVLLIAAGCILLAEWTLDVRSGGGQDAPARRSLGVSGGLTLLFVVLAGVATTAISHGSSWARNTFAGDLGDVWDLDQLFAQRSETQQELSAALGPGRLLSIENYRGNITVTGSSTDGQVHVSAHQRISAWQSSELQKREQTDKPTLTRTPAGIALRTSGEERDQTDLVLEVPHEVSVRIGAEKGDVTLSELRGSIDIADHAGNLSLTAITGDVRAILHDDNATFTAHSLSGSLLLDGRSGDIGLSDLNGPVTLHGDFFGTTHLEHVKGVVHFESSFTDLVCQGIPGQLNVEGRNDLEAEQIDGPVTLTTSDRNLTLSDVRNGAHIQNSKGSVTLSLLQPLGPVSVDTTDGTIDLRLPDDAAFHMVAETHDGDLENDFGLSATQSGDHTSLTGKHHDGGPLVQVRTSNGDVTLRKRDAAQKASQEDED